MIIPAKPVSLLTAFMTCLNFVISEPRVFLLLVEAERLPCANRSATAVPPSGSSRSKWLKRPRSKIIALILDVFKIICVLPDWKRKILALVAGFGTTGFLHVVRDFTFKCGFDKVVADLKSNKSEVYSSNKKFLSEPWALEIPRH